MMKCRSDDVDHGGVGICTLYSSAIAIMLAVMLLVDRSVILIMLVGMVLVDVVQF